MGSWASKTVDGTHSGWDHHAELLEVNSMPLSRLEANENTYVPPDWLDKSPGVAKSWLVLHQEWEAFRIPTIVLTRLPRIQRGTRHDWLGAAGLSDR